ncbi:hypothetical protein G4Z16_12680 [Streptomyces bathyalis]|uniref:Uncharacterized protein n=2 Tax=Streptomyces bathyalis TaxID=2710756 RepID=A0A7T1T630_9ACTN|nr:hypothetical protein G4Z16_12680 [Streptomyces bathyalis]
MTESQIRFILAIPKWPLFALLTVLLTAALLAAFSMALEDTRGRSFWYIKDTDSFKAARRYALVMVIADTITACADAYESRREERAPALRQVSRHLAAVTRSLRTAYKYRGSVPLRSHRRQILDMHARQVIAAIHKTEERLDRDTQSALQELSEILLTISQRYCDARVGALLNDEQIEGVQPGPDREWLRIVAWAALSTGAVILISRLGLSSGAEPIVMIFVVLIVMAIVWNRKVRQAFDLLGIVVGGP